MRREGISSHGSLISEVEGHHLDHFASGNLVGDPSDRYVTFAKTSMVNKQSDSKGPTWRESMQISRGQKVFKLMLHEDCRALRQSTWSMSCDR